VTEFRLTINVTYHSKGIAADYVAYLIKANTAHLIEFMQNNDMLCSPPMQHGVEMVDVGYNLEKGVANETPKGNEG